MWRNCKTLTKFTPDLTELVITCRQSRIYPRTIVTLCDFEEFPSHAGGVVCVGCSSQAPAWVQREGIM